MLNLHHLRLFRAVAREGSLTQAARGLNISQSAVSTQIKTLEASLGHDLFERRGRSLVLTEAGRIALDHAEDIFRVADDLTARLSPHGGPRQALRIGALATLSRNFQLSFLQPLIGRTDVAVVLRSGAQDELLRQLDAGALDVVLTNLAPARDSASPYRVIRLAEQTVSLVATTPSEASVETLIASKPLILPTPESPLRAGFDALLDRLRVTPQIAAEVDDMAMIRLLTRAGVGLAVIPPIVVKDELAAGTLVEVAQLDTVRESFMAVSTHRQFPNPLLQEILHAPNAASEP